jgi:hypothetical protein
MLRIPPSVPVDELVDVADEIDRLESEVFSLCQGPSFSVDALAKLSDSVLAQWPDPRGTGAVPFMP